MFWKKKTFDTSDSIHLNLLLQYYRAFYEEHKSLKPRTEKLEAENKVLKQSLKAILNYFQIELTPDNDNCYKRSKVRKSDFRPIEPLH